MAGTSAIKGGEVDTAYGRGDAWFVHADSVGNFLNSKVLGSSQNDRGQMIYPLFNGSVIAGGFYYTDDGAFITIKSYGGVDAFITILAPWNQTEIKQISTANNEVKMYPNPANGYVNIRTEKAGSYQLLISDIIGKIIYNSSFNDKIQIPVPDWNKGIYFVQVISENGFKATQKLLVE